jgi:hypothetical protein
MEAPPQQEGPPPGSAQQATSTPFPAASSGDASPTRLYKLSGWAAMLDGILIAVIQLVSVLIYEYFGSLSSTALVFESAQVLLGSAIMVLLIVALLGLHARQAERSGKLERVGFVLTTIGAGILAALWGFEGTLKVFFGFSQSEVYGLEGPLVAWGFLVGACGLSVGLALFGIATVRVGILPRWAAVILAFGLPFTFGAGVLPIALLPG